MNEQEKYDWMVYVSCMTFNHAPFIEDAMNGFTMQETNFPFVCAIVDDASTDGEQEVIKNYLNEHFDLEDKKIVRHEETDDYILTFARHNTNLNCFFAVIFLKYNHYSIKKPKLPYIAEWRNNAKYVAICEGDDYWIQPRKLQIQIEFMETHPDYSMCHGDANYYVYEKKWNKGRIGLIQSKGKSFDSTDKKEMFYRILTGKYPGIVTCTTCVRNSFCKKIPVNKKKFMMGDKPLWLDLSQMGRIKYFDEVFGVYVKHQGSATRTPETRLKFTLNAHEMKIYYCQKYNYPIPSSILKLYEKGYLDLLFNGIEMPILDMPELVAFKKKVGHMKTNGIYKEVKRRMFSLASICTVLNQKVNILYLYISNHLWRLLNKR